MAITLVLGGARSGKSAFAENLAHASALPVTYIATGLAGDAEMTARILQHRARRPAHWRTVEAPLALADALAAHAVADGCVLVDCLTLWLTNLLFHQRKEFPDADRIDPGPQFTRQLERLIEVLPCLPGNIIVVSNEIGFGVTPMGAVPRFFVDEAGRLNQRAAAVAQHVRLIVAGYPVNVKG